MVIRELDFSDEYSAQTRQDKIGGNKVDIWMTNFKPIVLSQHVSDFVEQIDLNLIRKSHLLSLRDDLENMKSLMNSIRQVGLLQPILVRRTDDGFEIVAGHRRYDACRRLRWRKIPACITELSDKEAFEVALTENVQRRSLNPIQEAEAFRRYVTEYGWGGVSELARRIAKSQEYVSQRLMLLSLPEEVRQKMITRELNPSAARELIWIKDSVEQVRMADFIVKNKIATRAVRYMVRSVHGAFDEPSMGSKTNSLAPEFSIAEIRLKATSNPTLKVVEKTILALRICMLRLDSLLNGMNGEPKYIRELLMEQRRAVHKLIDDAVKVKVALKRNAVAKDIVQ